MIPKFNQAGVLPPFTPGKPPTDRAGMAPYRSTITEFVERYSSSPERITILKGLLSYRRKLRAVGVTKGFQWIDGSFVENVESNRSRPPADVDIVTFADRALDNIDDWKNLSRQNLELFHPEQSKRKYSCDAYFVDLKLDPSYIVNLTRYWFGLFSHQRDTYLWKGMIEIPIQCSDDEALKILEEVKNV